MGLTGNATVAPTSDQFATWPVRSLQGSSGATAESGRRGDATRAIPSGTPMFPSSCTGSRRSTGVAATLGSVGVAGGKAGVAGDLAVVAGAVAMGAASLVSLPGASTV